MDGIKQSVMRHLREEHDVAINLSRFWCNICKSLIAAPRIKTRSYFQYRPLISKATVSYDSNSVNARDPLHPSVVGSIMSRLATATSSSRVPASSARSLVVEEPLENPSADFLARFPIITDYNSDKWVEFAS